MVDLEKSPAVEPRPATGPAWLVVPARILAVIIVVPLRLAYELVRLLSPARLFAPVGRLMGWLYRWTLVPLGRALAWLAATLVWAPLRWFGANVLLPLGLGLVWLAVNGFWNPLCWFGANVLLPLGRGLVWLFANLVVRPLTMLVQALAWLGHHALVVPARALWRYVLWPPLALLGRLAALVGNALAAAAGWTWWAAGRVLHFLIVVPARLLWAGLVWTARTLIVTPARWIWAGLVWAGRTLVVEPARWAWRVLSWLGRVLIVIPVVAVWRGAVWTGRTLVVEPVRWAWRIFVVAPARWTRDTVLRPVGRAVRSTWRVAVAEPARRIRHEAREAVRQVTAPFRRT
ncbi:hypothetical protein DPM19_18455 [Actinomadura craniellae]|uniref:Uncharacterized protein n=1 Tax=Actinomadura craniellae TaxID=2231787 RepID=A0A365H5Z1_9ACTN|nr:hypothetical protein [Actinomadura craniellae]RAY13653.1 hypothetical protein DPM19_18455 [Actinomadura craniellae]